MRSAEPCETRVYTRHVLPLCICAVSSGCRGPLCSPDKPTCSSPQAWAVTPAPPLPRKALPHLSLSTGMLSSQKAPPPALPPGTPPTSAFAHGHQALLLPTRAAGCNCTSSLSACAPRRGARSSEAGTTPFIIPQSEGVFLGSGRGVWNANELGGSVKGGYFWVMAMKEFLFSSLYFIHKPALIPCYFYNHQNQTKPTTKKTPKMRSLSGPACAGAAAVPARLSAAGAGAVGARPPGPPAASSAGRAGGRRCWALALGLGHSLLT